MTSRRQAASKGKESQASPLDASSLAQIVKDAVHEAIGPGLHQRNDDGLETVSEKILRGAIKGKSIHPFIHHSNFTMIYNHSLFPFITDPQSGDFIITRAILANRIASNKKQFSKSLVREAKITKKT